MNELPTMPTSGGLSAEERLMRWRFWFVVSVSLLLLVLFVGYLPLRFLHQAGESREEGAEEGPRITVDLTTEPAQPVPGTLATLLFSLKDEDGMPLQGLAIEHERLLHVLIVREDFSTFAHVHPEDGGPITDAMLVQARFPVTYVFPEEGRYLVSVDFLHEAHHGSEQFLVDIGERGTPSLIKDFSRTKTFGAYDVTLSVDPSEPRSGQPVTLFYRVKENGIPVTDLEPYLAAPMHLAVVSADLSSFTHTHGEVHDAATGEAHHELEAATRFGPDIEAHVVFPYPGFYQVFGEFKRGDDVVVTSFLLEVGAGEASFEGEVGHRHD